MSYLCVGKMCKFVKIINLVDFPDWVERRKGKNFSVELWRLYDPLDPVHGCDALHRVLDDLVVDRHDVQLEIGKWLLTWYSSLTIVGK